MTTPTPRQWQLLAYLLIAIVALGCSLVILTVDCTAADPRGAIPCGQSRD